MNDKIKTVTSHANPTVKDLRALSLRKHRDDARLFLVEGAAHIRDALAAGWRVAILACTDTAAQRDRDVVDAATGQDAQALCVTEDILRRITGRDNTQDMVAALHQRVDTLGGIGPDAQLWLAVEDIRDPGNLGTIMRTAAAVKAAGIVLIGQTCDPFSPEAVRATTGAFSRLRIIRATVADVAAWRPAWPGRVTGTHLRTETDYRAADYALPLMLVMGSEQSGLSDTMAGLCDTLVKIPMPGGTESLNLGVATALMLYEASRSRL